MQGLSKDFSDTSTQAAVTMLLLFASSIVEQLQ
jgi:hypothetical protein